MRELKFRAWHIKDKLMLEWGLIMQTAFNRGDNPLLYRVIAEKDYTYSLMQFTGLKDNKGIEIYEGDIVYIAGYGNYLCEFPFIQLYEAAPESDIESILGNIYENPELLEKSS